MLDVAVVGRGAIGAPIAQALRDGAVAGARLSTVLARSVKSEGEVPDLGTLLERRPSLVIEAAGQLAAKAYAVSILSSGADLLLFSVGALADTDFETACRDALESPRAGRLLLSTGAVGGLDMLKALRAEGRLQSVRLRSTTRAASLVQPWMAPEEVERLTTASEPVVVFRGSAREACRKFPASANVSAAIGLSSLGLDAVEVELSGDPHATAKTHEIVAVSPESSIFITVENQISLDNPRTSLITPYAALRLIAERTDALVAGV